MDTFDSLRKQFYRAVLSLRDEEDCDRFFRDICTIKEMQELPQRLEVARLLSDGRNYQEITEKTTVSSATISRVSRCLLYGDGGYRRVLERLGGKENE
jgi:TrpR-related protein YerC/YecD